jgi:hypothetical protein
MTNDSPLPPGAWDRLASSGHLCRALTQLRAFEQALAQDTAYASHVRSVQDRRERRASARPGTVDLADCR